jgi:hypothetical protein
MRKPDEEVLEPDLSNENDELPKPPEDKRKEIDYGILIYVDELGEQGLEIIGKDRCNLNHLLALVETAKRKLCSIWDSKNNPATEAVLRDIAMVKQMSLGNSRSLKAIAEMIKGLGEGLGEIMQRLDTHTEDDIDASETENPVQAE